MSTFEVQKDIGPKLQPCLLLTNSRGPGMACARTWRNANLCSMDFTTVFRDLFALMHPIISNHTSNTQTVIGKYFATSLRLCHAVFICGAPGLYRRFIPEK